VSQEIKNVELIMQAIEKSKMNKEKMLEVLRKANANLEKQALSRGGK
jgi:hypothetical protein